jgi:hypothetical protein
MKRPAGISRQEYAWVRREASRHFVRGGHLWRRSMRRNGKYGDPILMVDDPKIRDQLIRVCHIDQGHKGREATVAVLKTLLAAWHVDRHGEGDQALQDLSDTLEPDGEGTRCPHGTRQADDEGPYGCLVPQRGQRFQVPD